MSSEKVSISTTSQFDFKYEKASSYLENYQQWRTLNQQERQAYGDEQLSAEQAEQVFSKMYGDYK